MSRAVSLSSQPPKTQAMLSSRLTVCPRMLRWGIAPYTGARLQYINALGASSASLSCGSRGVLRVFGIAVVRDDLPSLDELPAAVDAPDSERLEDCCPLRVSDDGRPLSDLVDDLRDVPELLDDFAGGWRAEVDAAPELES